MTSLFFGSWISTVNTAIVLGMLLWIAFTALRRKRIGKWGRRVAVFILVGTAVSGLSATRDLYMMPGALFAADGIQSTVCSIAGGLIFLTGLVCLILRKNQPFRQAAYFLISGLFLLQVLVIETSRITMFL